jgi:hypothetical protein
VAGGVTTEVELNGAPVTAGEFGNFDPVAAIETSTGYELMWQETGASEFGAWNLNASGDYVSNATGIVAGTSPTLEAAETAFNQDFNGDSVIGFKNPTPIQTDTGALGVATTLDQIGNNYGIAAGGTDVVLQLEGAPVTAGEFGNFNPIAAVETSTGYELMWKDASTSQFAAWNLDSSGDYASNAFGVVSATNVEVDLADDNFNQNFNSADASSLNPTSIQTDTGALGIATTLGEIGNTYVLTAGGTTVELQFNGAAVTAGEFGSFNAVAAVETSTGYELMWEDSATSQFAVWNLNAGGDYVSNATAIVAGTSATLEAAETTFNQDFNSDSVIGFNNPTPIQTDTGALGVATTLDQVGNNYGIVAGGTDVVMQFNGAAVTAGEFGSFNPVAAVETSTGYELIWQESGGSEFAAWNLDNNGNYVSNAFGIVPGTNVALESAETTFNQDLNGDGVIGINVGAGATVEVPGADAAAVTFAASTGTLKLDQPSAFSGEIIDFTGTTQTNSDQIDLVGIKFAKATDSYTNGILAVTDGTNTANLDFAGSYTLASFNLASDSSGNTIVYDPPLSGRSRGAVAGNGNDAFAFSNFGSHFATALDAAQPHWDFGGVAAATHGFWAAHG